MGASTKRKQKITAVLAWLEEATGLKSLIVDSKKHIKVRLWLSHAPEHVATWILAATPSDRRAGLNSLQALKRELQEKFGIVIQRPLSSFRFELIVDVDLSELGLSPEERKQKQWDALWVEAERILLDDQE